MTRLFMVGLLIVVVAVACGSSWWVAGLAVMVAPATVTALRLVDRRTR